MRNSVPASNIHSCVNTVDSSGKAMWVTTVVIPQPLVTLGQAVGKARVLYTSYIQLLQGLIHAQKPKFESVKSKFLHTIHRTNNNKEILNIFYLLIKGRKK